jgi:hypothetical protein
VTHSPNRLLLAASSPSPPSFSLLTLLPPYTSLSSTALPGLTSAPTHLSLPPSDSYLALLTAETLTVATVDLSATILTFNASGSPPLSLRWCGDDAVSLLYAGASSAAAVLVGPFGDYKSFTYVPTQI